MGGQRVESGVRGGKSSVRYVIVVHLILEETSPISGKWTMTSKLGMIVNVQRNDYLRAARIRRRVTEGGLHDVVR